MIGVVGIVAALWGLHGWRRCTVVHGSRSSAFGGELVIGGAANGGRLAACASAYLAFLVSSLYLHVPPHVFCSTLFGEALFRPFPAYRSTSRSCRSSGPLSSINGMPMLVCPGTLASER